MQNNSKTISDDMQKYLQVSKKICTEASPRPAARPHLVARPRPFGYTSSSSEV